MPDFEQGDIIRVPFPYTDRDVLQRRPALVVSVGTLGAEHALLWVLMITSAENRAWPGDVAFAADYRAAGLPAPSVVRTSKIATIEKDRAQPLGRATPNVMADVLHRLHDAIGCPATER